nr:immunoglobulin light chain junction region [Macaca mulatta]
CQHHSSYPYSF